HKSSLYAGLFRASGFGYTRTQMLNPDAVGEVAEGFALLTSIAPDLQERAHGRCQVLEMDQRGIERVQTSVGLVAPDVDVIDIFRAPDDADIPHVGTRAAIWAASHAYTHRLVFQSQRAQFLLYLADDGGRNAFGLRQGQTTGWQRGTGQGQSA